MLFDQNIQQIIILFGAFLGNFVTTMIPFWKAKLEFEEFDIKIFFDHKFLGTALVSGITSFVIIGSLYQTVLTQIPSGEEVTLVMAFLSAALIGAGLNKGFNLAIPSPNTEQKQQLEKVQANKIIADWEEDKLVFNIKKDEELIAESLVGENNNNDVTPKA
ncbi:MAG: hypothetical protein L0H53_04505 [Candidatus Nitrosocosmicus sp.]|nr:hypothetical protein [Candidatus Nitrosocosmicus sp.]